uniref:Uncharacterized protein n=1 Tax=Amphimedon queenslandica TaxID=400682 RepID=A0A1X7TWS1_AMPQE
MPKRCVAYGCGNTNKDGITGTFFTDVQQDRSSPANDEENEEGQHDGDANVTQTLLSFDDSSSDTEFEPNNVAKRDYHVSRKKKRSKKHKGSQATVQCLSVGTQSQ